MKTTLRSQSVEITTEPGGPFTNIREKINPTGHKKLAAHLKQRESDYIRDLALKQVEAGTGLLDVNAGVAGEDEVAPLPEVCQVDMAATDAPLCIDSPNRETLVAALAVVSGKPVVNSVNREEKSMQAVLPLVKETGPAVIGLTVDDDGIPGDLEVRLPIAENIIERGAQLSIPTEEIIIDPLMLTAGMFPDLPRARFGQVGNAAGTDARLLIVSAAQREAAGQFRSLAEYIELTIHPEFESRFTQALFFN